MLTKIKRHLFLNFSPAFILEFNNTPLQFMGVKKGVNRITC